MPTLTGNSRRREQQLQSLLLDRLVLKYEVRIRREIRRYMYESARAVESGLPVPDQSDHQRRIRQLLTSAWNDAARLSADRILGAKKAVTPTQIMDGVMSEWVREYGAQKITQISDTTRADVGAIVAQGIREGESERSMAKLIRSAARAKSASRAQTIARTETHAASQASSQASAEATGLQMERVWVASQGERTRDTHDAADGQRVGMNEPFIVGGSPLMYPGDPNGPAREVINCRCAVIFEVVN